MAARWPSSFTANSMRTGSDDVSGLGRCSPADVAYFQPKPMQKFARHQSYLDYSYLSDLQKLRPMWPARTARTGHLFSLWVTPSRVTILETALLHMAFSSD